MKSLKINDVKNILLLILWILPVSGYEKAGITTYPTWWAGQGTPIRRNRFHIKSFVYENYEDCFAILLINCNLIDSLRGHFLSPNIEPSEGHKVILKTRSLTYSHFKPVYSIVNYNNIKLGSDRINITIGKKHAKRYFIVRKGTNVIQYEIIDKNRMLLEKGVFNVYVTQDFTEGY